ncbi:MAG: helix-hairpin-helix domain-containing protein [Chitinophagales bacterium]
MGKSIDIFDPLQKKKESIKSLQIIPGVGKSIAMDLYNLGIRSVSDLKGKSPELLYKQSNERVGVRQDPCLLYVFRCAVYFAETPAPKKEKLEWWYWKDNP